jgi:hypothetical protein
MVKVARTRGTVTGKVFHFGGMYLEGSRDKPKRTNYPRGVGRPRENTKYLATTGHPGTKPF